MNGVAVIDTDPVTFAMADAKVALTVSGPLIVTVVEAFAEFATAPFQLWKA
jgi:hypothetical protein